MVLDVNPNRLLAFSRENLCLLDAVSHPSPGGLSGELVRFQRQILEIVTCASCSLLYTVRGDFSLGNPGSRISGPVSRFELYD
jgi:hypothetical protein